jgi:hypothetical protein
MTRKDFVEKLKDVHPGLWMALIIAIRSECMAGSHAHKADS